MKNGWKFPKKIFMNKSHVVIAVALFLVLGAVIFTVSVRGKGVRAKDSGITVQSASVTKGSISNTIDASGNLEAAETIDITVPAGIKVDEIKVESGEEVTKGQTLATINKTSVTRLLVEVKNNLESIDDELCQSGLSSLEKEELDGEKSELQTVEEKLTALYNKPVITAPADGIIGAVNVSENDGVSASASSANSSSSNSTGQSNSSLSQMSAENTQGSSKELLFLTADTEADDSGSLADDSDTESQLKTITDYSNLSIQVPVAGEAPQKSITETAMYTGTISWDCHDSTFQGGTVYTATIVLTAKSGYTFSETNLPIIKDASFSWTINHSGEGNALKIVAKYEKTSDVQSSQDDTSSQPPSVSNSGDSKTDSSTAGTDSESAANGSKNAGSISNNKSGNSMSGASGSMSGTKSGSVTGSTSSSGSTSGSSSASSTEYDSYEAVAFTIARQDNAKIVVNVDELDILSVVKEQSALITLDALENEQYTGTVTKVSNTATAGSGSTKYEVEITVPMEESMRIGMSASAAIQVSRAEDTLLLPMTALQQRGEDTFVYTAKDDDGNLSGEVAVETGLSDGQNVEILSGLSEGDEVYYTRTAADSEESFNEGIGFPGNMGNSGERPDNDSGTDRNRPDAEGFRGGKTHDGNKPSEN